MVVPVTEAAKDCDCPAATIAAVGEIKTVTEPETEPDTTVRESDDDAVVPRESFTDSEAICVPAVVGVPLIVPVLLMERPLGRPLADHAYGETPPVAARFAEYVAPTVPAGRVDVEMVSGAGAGTPVGAGADDAPLNATISMA